jgi:uncharacterized protein
MNLYFNSDSDIFIDFCIGLVGLVGAFFGALVGGSGLVIIPSLIFLGFSPAQSVGILEIGALGMMLTGAYEFNKAQKIDLSFASRIALISVVGTIIGATSLIATPPIVAKKLFGIGLLCLLLHMIFSNRFLTLEKVTSKLDPKDPKDRLGYIFFFLNGLWNGYFSAGSHLLGSFILTSYYRHSIISASALLKIEGIFSCIASATIFIYLGLVDWSASITLCFAMALGGLIGCKWGLSMGEIWIRKFYLLVVGISSANLIFDF